MEKKKIESLSMEELVPLYDMLTNLSRDYTQVINSYALATGDNKFEKLPEDMENTIRERQTIFSLREKVKRNITLQILQNYE